MSHDPDALLGQAEDLVRRAEAAGADQAEAFITSGATLSVDMEHGKVVAGSAVERAGGSLRIVRDGRLGFAYFSRGDEATRAIQDALRLSRLAPDTGYRLPEPDRVPDAPPSWDDEVAALDPAPVLEGCQDLVRGILDTCPEAAVTGGGGLSWTVAALASSTGVATARRSTHGDLGAALVLQDGESAISVWDDSISIGAHPEAMPMGERLGALALSLRGPGDAAGGVKDIVLHPDPALALVAGPVLSAVEGDRALRGQSFWSDRAGAKVAHPGLTLLDHDLHPNAFASSPTDGEGLSTRRVPLVEGGVLQEWIFDSWDAHRHGRKSSHNGVRGGHKSPPSTGSRTVVLEHADALAMDALLAGVDDGYLVESVLGAHTANATTGDFSVTAPNVWRIQGGAVVGACKEIAIAGNLPELLPRLDAVGADPRVRDGSIVPAVRLRDVQVSA